MIVIRRSGEVKLCFQIDFVSIARVSEDKISFSEEETSIQASSTDPTLNYHSEKERALHK